MSLTAKREAFARLYTETGNTSEDYQLAYNVGKNITLEAIWVAECVPTANNCAGWQQISLKPDIAVYLAGQDIKTGTGISGHNAYGKKAGCW